MLLVRAANTTPSINIASCHSTDSTVLPALPRRARVNGGVFAAPRLPGDATGIEREERHKKEEITETGKKPRKKKNWACHASFSSLSTARGCAAELNTVQQASIKALEKIHCKAPTAIQSHRLVLVSDPLLLVGVSESLLNRLSGTSVLERLQNDGQPPGH